MREDLIRNELSENTYPPDPTEAAELFNSPTVERLDPLTSADLLAWSAVGDRLKNITNAKNNLDHPANGPATAAWITLQRDNTTVDLNLTSRADLLDGLVSAGVLSADDKESLIDLATVDISRAEQLGLGVVRPGEIERARS